MALAFGLDKYAQRQTDLMKKGPYDKTALRQKSVLIERQTPKGYYLDFMSSQGRATSAIDR
jgi:hypothetical protein